LLLHEDLLLRRREPNDYRSISAIRRVPLASLAEYDIHAIPDRTFFFAVAGPQRVARSCSDSPDAWRQAAAGLSASEARFLGLPTLK
jgi:hypothetical protein